MSQPLPFPQSLFLLLTTVASQLSNSVISSAGVDRRFSRKRRLGNEDLGTERVRAVLHIGGKCGRAPAFGDRERAAEVAAGEDGEG